MGNIPGNTHQTNQEEEVIVKCEVGDMVKQFFKDSVIVWHDPNIDSPENKPFISQLENLRQVKTFTQFGETFTFLKETKATCHVITTSETHLGEFIAHACERPNVYGVYVLSKIQENWHSTNPKVLCVETNIHNLLFKVEQNLMKSHEEEASSRFSFAPIFNEADKKKLSILHMYLTVIPAFKNRSQAKTDFLTLCKVLYSDEKNFDFIINLAQYYDWQNVFKWYSEKSLFPRVIDTCLRIASSDSLQYCRLPIQDLQKAIQDQYQKESKDFSGLLFRAAYLSQEEWTNLKGNLNKEIETMGFFSTSKDPRIALNSFQTDPNKKVLITILVPKGPNQEEYGFAEIDFEHQILFSAMSRFTILEANEHYSQELPYRHLALLYGTQGYRKYLTEKYLSHIQKISLGDLQQISCYFCDGHVLQESSNFFFRSLFSDQKSFYCQECLYGIPPTIKTPFLCVPLSNHSMRVVKGFALTYPPNLKIPFYGYKCYCQESNRAAKLFFKCTQCPQKWCESCINYPENCIKAGHNVVLETTPWSFWQEKMSENEFQELKFEREMIPKEDLYRQAKMFFQAQEYEKELEYLLKLVKLYEKTKSSTSSELESAYVSLAHTYFRRREYAKAIQYFLELEKMFQLRNFQVTDPQNEPLFDSLTQCYYCLREYPKAEEYCLKALEISILASGNNHPKQAKYYKNLGSFSLMQGNYQKAVEYSLKGFELSKGSPQSLLFCCMNLSPSYISLGNYKKAEEYCIRALEITKSNPGDNSQDLASCYNLFGQVYEAQGDYKKAEEYCLKAVETFKEDTLSRSDHLNSLGEIYQLRGQYEKAFELHSQVLEKLLSIYEENSIHLVGTYYFLARVYCPQGEYSKALEYCLRSMEIFKKTYGENHESLRYDYRLLGKIYEKKGEYSQALQYYLKAQELLKTINEKNHPDMGEYYCDLGKIYNHLGEYEKALEYQFRALQITEMAFEDVNKDHPNLADCYSGLGRVYSSKKDYKAAMDYHLKSLDIRARIYEEKHPDVAVCYADLGDACKGEGNDEKAREYYMKAWEMRKLMLGENHPDSIFTRKQIEEVQKWAEIP